MVLKPWLKKQWCIPEVGAEFVAALEDVLEVYAEPYDPTRPKVNFDETTKQLIKETRQPLPAQLGRPQRYDYEYERNGTRNLFLFVEPQAGRRHVQVTEQRTKLDFAHAMQWLVDEGYPEATVIRVVLDNLNTHKIASLYTYCISSNNSAIALPHQRLPTSIQWGEATARRRKEEGRVGSASRGMVRRWGRFFSRGHHGGVPDRDRVPERCHYSGVAVDVGRDAPAGRATG